MSPVGVFIAGIAVGILICIVLSLVYGYFSSGGSGRHGQHRDASLPEIAANPRE